HLIVYLFYLRSLALLVRAKDVAVSVRNFMIAVGVSVVVYPIVTFVVLILASLLGAATQMSSTGGSPPAAPLPVGIRQVIRMVIVMAIGAILALIGFVWYTRILIGLRDALDRAMDEPVARSPVWLPLFQGAAALFVIDLIGMIIVGIALKPSSDSMARTNL